MDIWKGYEISRPVKISVDKAIEMAEQGLAVPNRMELIVRVILA